MAAIVLAVIVANLAYLLDFSDPNPLGPRSGLATNVILGPAGGANTLDPNNAFTSQALGHRAMLDWLHLQIPWWNPFEGTGAPLAGEMQSAAFFPPTILTLLSNGQLYEHILFEIIAGLATFALLRRLGLGRLACVAAGVAFALNGTFAWFSHATVNPVAFLPLLLLGIERAYSAAVDGRRGGWWLIAVAGALSFYAGFPEVAYIDAVLAVCWLAWRCGCLGRARLRPLLVKGAVGALVGTLLCAPLLVAMVDYLSHADLAHHDSSFFGNGHISAQGLPQLLMPYIFGPIFHYDDPHLHLLSIWGTVGGYLSTSLLLFAVLGLFSRGRRGLRAILGVWIVLALARMYHEPYVVGRIFGLLPGMSRVVFFRYATTSVEFSMVVLAALGLSDLARRPEPRRRAVWVGLGLLAVVAIAGIAAHSLAGQLGTQFSHRPYYAGAIAWGCLILVAGVVISMLRNDRRRTWLAALLVAADALALFVVPEASAPRAVQSDLTPVTFLQRNLGLSRAFSLGPLAPNYGAYFGVAQLNVNDLPVPSLFTHYVHTRLDPYAKPTKFIGTTSGGRSLFVPSPLQELDRNLAAYRAASVKYVITPRSQPLPESPATFRLVFESPVTRIYELAGSAPYFTAPGCAVRPDGRGAVNLTCARPTVLVRRETYMPGWSATVDGRPVRIGRAGDLFQAVAVGAGSHRVGFGFSPPNVIWGWIGFLAGVVLLFAEPVRRLISRRASSPASASGGP